MQDASPKVLFGGEISREDRYRRANWAHMAHRDKSMTQIDQPGGAPMTILERRR
jgi:hypothetical protein